MNELTSEGVGRRLRCRLANNFGDQRLPLDRRPSTTRRILFDSRQSLLHKAISPMCDRMRIGIQFVSDVLVRRAVGSSQDKLCPQVQARFGRASLRPLRKRRAFLVSQQNRNRNSHCRTLRPRDRESNTAETTMYCTFVSLHWRDSAVTPLPNGFPASPIPFSPTGLSAAGRSGQSNTGATVIVNDILSVNLHADQIYACNGPNAK